MPEFMGVKITRAEATARRAYRRALVEAVRQASKGTGWRSIEGALFREESGWFIDVVPTVIISEHVTKATVYFKPMAIDPILWDILGVPENRSKPLSFRLVGAWTCKAQVFSTSPIEEAGQPEDVAARILEFADQELERMRPSYSLEVFLGQVPWVTVVGDFNQLGVVTMIAMGREDEALAVCDKGRKQAVAGGFLALETSFHEMAFRWLQARREIRALS